MYFSPRWNLLRPADEECGVRDDDRPVHSEVRQVGRLTGTPGSHLGDILERLHPRGSWSDLETFIVIL